MTWEGTPIDTGLYGSVAGVQAYLHMITFTANTNPTLAQVQDMLDRRTMVVDSRLAGAGYATPITAEAAVALLRQVVEQYVAAHCMERLVLGREPSAAKVESAAVWRREADQLLQAIVDGTTPLPGVSRQGGGSTIGSAGIQAGNSPAFPRSVTDDFTDAYGGQGT